MPTPQTKTRETPLSHPEALDLILRAATVTTLSYEEAIAVYLRARGYVKDGAKTLSDPLPADWADRVVIAVPNEPTEPAKEGA